MSDEDLTDEQRDLLKIVAQLVPATAQEVGAALGRLSAEMHKVALELDKAEEEAVDRIEAHGRAYDSAFLKSGFDPDDPSRRVTEKVREALAREKTWNERLKMEQAKQKVRALKRRLDTLDRRVFVGQSIAKTIRAEVRTLSYGQAS